MIFGSATRDVGDEGVDAALLDWKVPGAPVSTVEASRLALPMSWGAGAVPEAP